MLRSLVERGRKAHYVLTYNYSLNFQKGLMWVVLSGKERGLGGKRLNALKYEFCRTIFYAVDMRGYERQLFVIETRTGWRLFTRSNETEKIGEKFTSKFWWRHLLLQYLELSPSNFLWKAEGN